MLLRHQTVTESIYRTETVTGAQATWRVVKNELSVMFIRIPDNPDPAYRLYAPALREAMPNEDAGTIFFDSEAYPALAKARKWLPEYAHLWDEVAAEFREVLAKPRTKAGGCVEGRMGEVWLSQ
ncbi:hypothetical protein [Nocardia sp. NBC_00511]|uniref:hypothetical protein n=1 Tax=Nocardia sp. NBC_00511 TaxID=2903591 RepID=UPI0030DFF7BF